MEKMSNEMLVLYPTDDSIADKHFEVGSVYEIDHTNLPVRTSVQLRSIRVVMVYNTAFRFCWGFE